MSQLSYKPTGATALIIAPPPDVMGYADYYRARYLRATMHHIEPHITLITPFAPYEQLPSVAPRLRNRLAVSSPFRVSLRGFSIFKDSGILYLRPADPTKIRALAAEIAAEFPEYPPYGGKFGDNWDPHMTVGEFENTEELESVYSELAVQKLFIGFEVETVLIKYQTDDGIWDTWAEYPLGGAS